MVGRADHGAGCHVAEAHGLAFDAQRVEFVGVHVAGDRQVMGTGLQVLPQGQHLDLVGAQILRGDAPQDGMSGLAGMAHQAPSTVLYEPHYHNGPRWWTVMALANPGGLTATAGYWAFGPDGALAGVGQRIIAPEGRVVEPVRDLFGMP